MNRYECMLHIMLYTFSTFLSFLLFEYDEYWKFLVIIKSFDSNMMLLMLVKVALMCYLLLLWDDLVATVIIMIMMIFLNEVYALCHQVQESTSTMLHQTSQKQICLRYADPRLILFYYTDRCFPVLSVMPKKKYIYGQLVVQIFFVVLYLPDFLLFCCILYFLQKNLIWNSECLTRNKWLYIISYNFIFPCQRLLCLVLKAQSGLLCSYKVKRLSFCLHCVTSYCRIVCVFVISQNGVDIFCMIVI